MKALLTLSRAGFPARASLLVLVGLVLVTGATWAAAPALKFLDDPGEGDFDVTGTFKVASSPDARLVFNWQDKTRDHYLLTLSGKTLKLQAVVGGKPYPLGNSVTLNLAKGQSVPFTVQRRDWRLAVVWGERVVLRAYDARLKDGKVGSAAAGGAWEDLRVQPVGDIVVYDDFVREAGAESVWEPQCGTWQSRTLRDDQQAGREEADKSANAFSYFGTGNPRGVSVAGHWFWDRYALEASVKPLGGAAGIVFYYQDEENYCVLRMTDRTAAAPVGNRVQLLAYVGGQPKVLAERAGGFLPGQWYKLRVEVCEDRIRALVDGEVRLETRSTLFGQGQPGLYVEGAQGAFFDDVACDGWDMFREDFAVAVPGKWTLGAGWKQTGGRLFSQGAKASLSRMAGRWNKYQCTVDSQSLGGGVGLVFAYQSPTDYCLLRWAPATASCAYKGKAQLVHVGAKGGEVLAEQRLPAGNQFALTAAVDEGVLTGTVGNAVTLQAVCNGATGGALGLYAEGKGSFDNLGLSLIQPRRSSHVTKEFAISDKHPEMAEWASTRAPWAPLASGQSTWWTKGDYFGDTTVSFVVPQVGSRAGSLKAVLAGEPGSDNGLALVVTATTGAKKLALNLLSAAKPLGSAEVAADPDARVVFSREGRLAVVKVNDQVALTAPF